MVNGKKNDIIEIVYEYTLPRIMNGVYLVGAAVGQGTQSKHEMLTLASWYYGTGSRKSRLQFFLY